MPRQGPRPSVELQPDPVVVLLMTGTEHKEPGFAGAPERFTRLGIILILCVLAPACRSAPSLVPAGTGPPAFGNPLASTPSAAGVTIVGVSDEWRYSPGNLPQHVTPVRVKVTNQRSEPILLNLDDAALVDEMGARRPAVPVGDAVQRAARAGGGGGASGVSVRPGVSISQGIGVGGVGIQLGGIGIGGGGGPFGSPGSGEGDTIDALRVGLRPGRLDPGESVEGYLFFDPPLRASDRDHRFRLAWQIRPVTPIDAPLAPSIVTLEVPFLAR
ncbi:MAG: hypothetical protein ACE5FC_03150 [Myxococcota bacterium]